MSANETTTPSTAAEALADLDAVLRHIAAGTPVDPALARRVRERSERLTEQLRQRYGEMNEAVDLIRQTRDEE